MKVIIFALSVILFISSAFAQTNLVENSGFEAVRGDAPDNWSVEVHASQGALGTAALDAEEKASGKTSLRITNDSPQPAWVRASQEPIAARANHLYRFECRVKSTAPYLVLVYEFRKGTAEYVTRKIADGTAPDWTTVSATFSTGADATFKVSLITTAKGVAWFDDVTLVDVSEPPDLIAPKTTPPPTLDGKLDDAVWQSAATTQPFYLLNGNGALVKEQTTVAAAYDDKQLYLAFVCLESKPDAVKRAHTRDGEPVFLDDAVEIFVDPRHDHKTYYHFVVNANGARYTARTSARGLNADWRGNNPFGSGEVKWTARAFVGSDRWVAELALPFAELGERPRAGKVWGINFTRERRAEGEEFSTWAYIDGKTFHAPQRFGHLVFAADSVPAVREIKTPQIPNPKSQIPNPLVIPQPQRADWTSESFVISADTTLVHSKQIEPLEFVAFHILLVDDIYKRTGFRPRIARTPPRRGTNIVFALLSPQDAPLPPEGYRLQVSKHLITLTGADERGLWNGAQTLRQLLHRSNGKLVVPGAKIEDSPDLKIRAWHLIAPRQGDGEKFKRLVDVLALLKYNVLMIEVDGWLKYERHPVIGTPDAMSKAEMKELVDYAKARGFEVIPQVQTFGHFDYVLRHEEYKHLAESPAPAARRPPSPAYCPSNPETYKLVFDLFEEVIDIFQPRYFHIGHDEIVEYGRGDLALCERCKGTPPHELFANEVIKLHDYLKERGLTTLMWGDQLLAEHNGGPPFNTALATPLLPKDIIICDWHYEPRADYPSLRTFKDNGFPVIACGWYNIWNIFTFSTQARDSGLMGYSGTSWWNTKDIADTPEMMSAMVLTAENAWSTQKPALEQVPYHPTQEFRRLAQLSVTSDRERERSTLPVTSHHVSRFTFYALDLSVHANARLELIEPNFLSTETLPDRAFGDLPSGVQWLRGVPFEVMDPLKNRGFSCIALVNDEDKPNALPSRVYQIPVGAKAKSLFFLHTASKPRHAAETLYDRAAADPQRIGEYVITYTDGSRERVPLLYRKNIVDWNDRLGCSRADIGWLGRTASGALLLLPVWEWQNPYPEKMIRSIDVVSNHTEVRPVLLAVTGVRP